MSDIQQVEDILADETFQSWYFKDNSEKSAEWEKWLEEHPGKLELVASAIDFMNKMPKEQGRPDAASINSQLRALHEKLDGPAKLAPVRRLRKRWWAAAAAAVILLLAGSFYYRYSNRQQNEVSTSYAELCNKSLPDGSTMLLNANSQASLSPNWKDGRDREVWLKGEAFFTVSKTRQKDRFIVHSEGLDIIVTGTRFNVSNRHGKTIVFLEEGSVTLRTTNGQEKTMKPGDYLGTDNGNLVVLPASKDNILAWRENKMAFDGTPLTEVAQRIGDHYGVTVSLADESIQSRSVTGIMSNDNLEAILEAIQLTINVKVTRNTENKIILSDNK